MSKLFKARINSRSPNDAYRNNFDAIFGKKAKVEPIVEAQTCPHFPQCGCKDSVFTDQCYPHAQEA
jgi:hypothetical protein